MPYNGYTTVFIAELASRPSNPPLVNFCFAAKLVDFFAVFRLLRVHLSDLSTYFIDFLLLVKDALKPVLGCFFPSEITIALRIWFFSDRGHVFLLLC